MLRLSNAKASVTQGLIAPKQNDQTTNDKRKKTKDKRQKTNDNKTQQYQLEILYLHVPTTF